MSRYTYSYFDRDKQIAQIKLDNVIKRIEDLKLNEVVKNKIYEELDLETAALQLNTLRNTVESENTLKGIIDNANHFFNNLDTYIALDLSISIEKYNENVRKILEQRFDSHPSVLSEALIGVEDELLKNYIVGTYNQKSFSSPKALLLESQKRLQKSKLSLKKEALENLNQILRMHYGTNYDNIPSKNQINQIEELYTHIESVEKKVLDIQSQKQLITTLIKIAKNQGFIIKKENIREIDNHLVMYGVKMSGEEARFEVFTDGRFAYKYHEYEGMSCEKDVSNFEEQFELIYGVKLEEKKVVWQNPDRLQKMSHITMSTNTKSKEK